ncbi:molecular chaperone GrpE [Mucilaginibacter auburnensis]|uniref:Protein GrpE n=2 Tax=Mucilaginibacter auburnensis TaxID=1457233 RepID=A0A2H9VLY4_9SPHI|nr:molecular chaperone GrpE [Mucilaginibacter auburnensis]
MLKKKKTDNPETPEVDQENIDNNAVQPEEQAEVNTPSAEDVLKEELALANDKYLRLFAEFDNFRRRTRTEREEARKMEGKDVITALLPVLDDFERALKATENATDVTSVREGVMLIQNKLKNTLTQKGLVPMESIGSEFDADIHEAITNIPAPTEDMKGKVIDEMEKGYYLNDKVIRFAKVIVGA